MDIVLDTTLRGDSSTLEWDALRRSLEQLTKLCQDSESRKELSTSTFKDLSTIMETFVKDDLRYDVLADAFRFLRNSVVTCTKNQDIIRSETNLFETTDSILQRIVGVKVPETDTENIVVVVRCALQFLANSIVDNRENSETVCRVFSGILGSLTETFFNDEKVIQYAAMIGHLGLKQTPQTLIINLPFLRSLLNNLHLEFVIYTMESFVLKYGNFLEIYEDLEPGERIKLVIFLNEQLHLLEKLDEKIISMFKTNFIDRSDFILRSKIADRDNLFCWEIAVLLEFMCSASSMDVQSLRSDTVLLTTTLCLLRQIDAIGKETGDENVFSPVEDLAKLTSKSTALNQVADDDIRAHPTFQFKAHLVRLIANLSHKNKINQDKVRELECLPIILNNCKMDARNPFISQWSVLAIRNLCEGNDTNQAYIREVQKIDTENLLPKLQLVDLNETE